jgi:hypothetical protein
MQPGQCLEGKKSKSVFPIASSGDLTNCIARMCIVILV